jgi:hypothetical protein
MTASEHFNSQEIDALFTLGDSNNDGEIDLEEFIGVLYPVVAQALKKFTKGKQRAFRKLYRSQISSMQTINIIVYTLFICRLLYPVMGAGTKRLSNNVVNNVFIKDCFSLFTWWSDLSSKN